MDELLKPLNLEKEYTELINNRNVLVNKVLNEMVNWSSFFEYYPILKKILPIGKLANSMPITLDEYLEYNDFLHREATIYYDTVCHWIEDKDEDLLNEVKDYIKENMICGTTYDW